MDNKQSEKQLKLEKHRQFLLSFFKDSNNPIQTVNGYVLVKNINGVTGQEYVALYDRQSWLNYLAFQQSFLDSSKTNNNEEST